MWRDICIANRDRLLLEVNSFSQKLGAMQALLETADGAALEKLFAEARTARNEWIHSS
jgi:prephenate dehydrogenase